MNRRTRAQRLNVDELALACAGWVAALLVVAAGVAVVLAGPVS